jgi:hypothetical protein
MIAMEFTTTGSPEFVLAAHFNRHSDGKQVLAALFTVISPAAGTRMALKVKYP